MGDGGLGGGGGEGYPFAENSAKIIILIFQPFPYPLRDKLCYFFLSFWRPLVTILNYVGGEWVTTAAQGWCLTPPNNQPQQHSRRAEALNPL